jgi:CubicO group peptidase (beta-lactamase class C family)/D-alanyl-D-alanine dipeptidase
MNKGTFSARQIISFAILAALTPVLTAQNIAPAAPYQETARQLTRLIGHEMRDKQIPSIAIALVEDQKIVWAQGFGWQDAAQKIPATADTIYRVGSVSKLFTDIGVMEMVEQGKLDLDVPVERYIPDFHPHNPFGGPITLRELMAHRAGLVREPPVGNYFDNSGPTLQQTIRSLNQTALVYAPGTTTKYSNAGVAVVGYVLQTLNHQPYAEYLRRSVLLPLGMRESSFGPDPSLASRLAEGTMWSYDGLRFTAPTFQLGEGPCGSLYTNVADLGKFLSFLIAGGKAEGHLVLRENTLDAMWKPAYEGQAANNTFGIGFLLQKLDGHLEVGHGGAIYGFSTQLEALPREKLGVVVITSLDSTNAVAMHISRSALRDMLAVRSNVPLPAQLLSHRLPAELATRLNGEYAAGDDIVELQNQEGNVELSHNHDGSMVELRVKSGEVIEDGRLGYSPDPIVSASVPDSSPVLHFEGRTYTRREAGRPAPPPPADADIIGEYGWDYDKLYLLQARGKLTALIEWFEFDPLTAASPSAFKFPDHGLYKGEEATILRDSAGRVTGVKVGAVVFPRRHTNAPGEIFQITPLRPVNQLRADALRATPPEESGYYRDPDLVDVTRFDPEIHLDIRYATTRNFLSSPMYTEARAFMQRPAAEALGRAAAQLEKQGYGLLIHDAYRPWYVTKMFWDGTPDDKKQFVADPSAGSRHNRGCAVDLTLYSLATGKPLIMTGGYDEMSERSYPFYPGGTSLERWQRNLLREAMEAQGFTVYEYEWWHFDYADWSVYPILNFTFEQIDEQLRQQPH